MPVAERRAALLALVRGVAATVLGHDDADAIDPATGFKDLGFDSLGAVEFRNRVRKATGLSLSSTAVFDHATPAALTDHLVGVAGPTDEPEPAAGPDPEPAVPLSRYQRDIVTTGLTYPDLPLSQPSGYVRLRGAPDVDQLRESVRHAAMRHDAMRLRIDVDGDEMRQRVLPAYPEVEVVSFLGEPDPRAACQEWIGRATGEAVALDGPLVRTTILIDDAGSLILYCRIHHAVADAWGINLMLREVCGHYRTGEAAGTPAPSCLDVAAEDHRYRASPQWRQDRDALVEAVGDLTPALFRRAAAVRDHRRHRRSAHLPARVADRARDTGRSVFAVTAAALAAYLRRVHRDGDIVLGVPLLNRRTPEELATMSDVTNILPLHVRVDERGTLLDLADRIRADVWDLTARQRFALGDLLAALREAGRRAPGLFDVTYSHISVPDDGFDDAELTVLASGYALDAVNIVVREHEADGSLDVDVFYADDVFDEDFSIEAALRQVLRLLDKGLRGTPLGELDLLGDAETDRIAGFERPHHATLDETVTLDRLVSEQAARVPDRNAVVGTEVTLTYAQFAERVARLAGHLRGLGLRPEECVPVIMDRSPEFVIAVHAVQAAGGAYVPVDPRHPRQRVRTMLTGCGARLAVGGAGLESLLDELGIRAVQADPPPGADSEAPAIRPGDLAYVIYTSGSTGTPKGVMIEHRSVVNRLGWMQRRYPLGADDVVLHKTPATFDVSVWELMWWAHTGASVAVAPQGAERDPRELTAAIERHAVTVVHFVPSMLGPFLDHFADDPEAAGRVRTLRRVFCSGEALTPALARRFRETLAEVDLVNLYGPTEATVDVSSYDVPRTGEITRVPIGTPIDNLALMVLDSAGRRCPVGVPGELNIAGAGVGRGYLGEPARTAEAFVADDSIPERRRYRTGDLARWLADGTVEYLGRLDDQVKIRGNRVALGEVEHALAGCPGVASAAVVDAEGSSGTRLVAYVVGEADRSSLATDLAERLPSYMIPADFVRLDRLPLTRSGKLDRRALPAPEHDGGREPGTDAERELAAVWRDVLGSDGFGVHDDFFTVGGDSILALRMRTEAERRGLPFDLDRFYARPTIAGLARLAEDAGGRSAVPAVAAPFELVPLIDRAGLGAAEDAFPATQLQLGMLFHSLQRADSPLYKDVFRYRLRMPWDPAAFRRAHDRLVRRQPALRSTFDLTGASTPLQIVLPEVPDTLRIDGEGDVAAYLREKSRAAYPLTGEALHGMRVFVREDGVDLVVHFHHAILDGWSVATLISELLRDYLAGLGAELPEAEPLPDATLLLAEHVRAERASREDRAAREFWAREVDGVRPTTIEPARAHTGDDGAAGQATLPLPRWLDRCVRQAARRRGVPVKSLLLAAHCLTLRAMSGSDDVVTGCVTHARPERAGSERCAGLFLNTVPVRLDAQERTWGEAADRVAAWERESFPHRRYPVSALVAEHGGPVFETAFNFVDYHVFDEVIGRVELADVEVREETNFALLTTALVDPRDGGISLRISADEAGPTAGQCARFGWNLVRILAELVRRPDDEIDLGVLRDRDVAELAAEVAARHPARDAVVHDAQRWDYRRLSAAADNVAQRLLGRGMPPGSRVAVRMRRSPELVAVVLGVLRAGAAVVPLDPTYPSARIRSMVEIAEPYLVVTDPDAGELLAEPDPEQAVPLPRIGAEDIAYVLFTSGSTGEPKGVAMPHRALTNLIEWQHRRPTGGAGRHTLQFAPLSFDVAFQEIFSTLCAAGTLHVIDADVHADLGAVLRAVDERGINRIFLPYVALQAMAEVAAATGTYPASLRAIVSSGEQLRITPEIRALCAAHPGTVLENQYGPTETHVVLAQQLPADPADHPPLPPVGHPILRTAVELLDQELEPVLPGVPGEIYVSGACVARGYHGRPALTAERFVAGPDGSVRYRTGDIGVALPGGEIVCLGRADGQVKVRGFRVECAEIELAVLALAAEGIEQVAVVPRELGGADAVLHAFLAGDPDKIEIDTVRRELGEVLPPHLVPARFRWVEAMPLTPSGKRDDAALRALGSTPDDAPEPTGDDLQDEIAALLAEFAGVDDLAAGTSFFDAGGTSIGATRVSMTIARRWGVELPLQTFLAAPTARQLAGLVRSHDGRRGFDPVVTLREPADPDRPPLFLVHPIGGNVLCYRELAARLPGDRAVYGLQAAGAEPGTEPLESMEALAGSYLAAIRRVCPSGPLHLAGWSFGGYVAVEMARRLDDADVASLTLLDTVALDDGHRPVLDESRLISLFFRELLWSSGASDDSLDLAATEPGELFDAVFRRTVELGILPADGSPRLLRRLYRVFRANYQATVDYRVTAVHPGLVVLQASDPLPPGLAAAHRTAGGMFDGPANGWEQRAGHPVETVRVPGNHLSMMDPPQAAAVAAELGGALARAEAGRRAGLGVAS
ncbi:amino acid adenylation domain-containing protein [Actinoplanes sp. NPDC005259]